ncbi:L-serine ammonia-lyase [Trametes versicolor FP-101664 SS1]|uniref:L-serine ammonia-lyase n=1 Tax=Trametes versicolor (strain FP-101664) TaxID=717944 RepID=UPI00046225BB|nr:L-serine ammonia-lyase [Trametes versicolor FP-101664 SS1]EIW58703.1 L-serine ammonia-lyase [Trametes versicolor FP-101664 SS1]
MLTATRLRVLRARRATVAAVASNSSARQTSSYGPRLASGRAVFGGKIVGTRHFASSATRREEDPNAVLERLRKDEDGDAIPAEELTSVGSHEQQHEHAVISTFDLFSIGVGPSSSHTVGPMRAGKIFIGDLDAHGLLEKVKTVKISLYGSLAATGKGHHTPQAILLGLEGSDPETIDTGTIPSRYAAILENKILLLGGRHHITYDMDRDMVWRWDQVLKTHPNGMRFSAFGEDGDLLATNEYFSVGGGFVVNEKTKVDENLFYKGVDKSIVHGARLQQTHSSESTPGAPPEAPDPIQPPYPFVSGDSLLALTKKHNMTIAQIVYDNELHFGYSHEDIHEKLMRIWGVMDECIRTGVSSAEEKLPGRLGLRRRAPMLYRRLMRGFYPGLASPHLQQIGAGSSMSAGRIDAPDGFSAGAAWGAEPDSGNGNAMGPGRRISASRPTRVVGTLDHPVTPMAIRKTTIPAMDFLSCYAIAVNEVNASGGRIVTSPTNGAAGVIPAVLKYIVEFISDDPEKAVVTFLLTASAVGMLFKRGSTISAAEGGCQAEVGVACSMASAGFAACMGASPETVLQAAEIGIEHNLGLTCDPIDGLVQVPCIERNSLGAVKAVTAAQLSMASQNVYSVTLDEAIEAMRLTAADMSVKYKETSLSGLARTVRIPLTVPAC